MRPDTVLKAAAVLFVGGCAGLQSPAINSGQGLLPVAAQLSQARAPDGQFISWREHLIDTESVNGGIPIRGGDGLAMADLDRDGFADVVSVHEDSGHIRIAFGSAAPNEWTLVTLAHGKVVGAVEDIAIGDLNGDGWLDLVAACEDAHLAYFQNPGTDARFATWPSIIPEITQSRGSWLRVFVADMNGDGRLDITAANKGGADIIAPEDAGSIVSTTSMFLLDGPPLDQSSWREQVLLRRGIANTAMPVDIDGDGDLDVLAAARSQQQLFILENTGSLADGTLEVIEHEILITPAFDTPAGWSARSNAFQSDFADLNGDGRPDLVVNVLETAPGTPPYLGLGWLEQPENLSAPWRLHRIGHILPDWIAGLRLADIDNDGDLDAIVGGYSGLNILAGAYSGAPRLRDDPSATAVDTLGRISWFENPGNPGVASNWTRHDVSRRVRDMNDGFVPVDLDNDGDLDFVTTRGNSGELDGVFWLEQVRTPEAQPQFTPARSDDSRSMPPPPEDWIDRYRRDRTYTPAANTQ